MAEHGIDRALVVPPGTDPALTDYALECAARYPDRFAVMGWYVQDDPGALAGLDGWLARPGMVAIRFMFRTLDRAQWRPDGPIHPFLSAAERLGIPVSLVGWEGLAGLGPAFGRYPSLRLL